ncbi:hypothetical protein CCAX7_36500 [Capsulimonas corticalis]|uniref:Uncharacterized protein n=1 Tax=Capsulimonas corticalis TaxID=2219043 RepID=A0A402D1H8_9BACT|nr:hypothetical protein [Capsulimonas corticalis]BDI31599.1 hypothetical protein CCAX7_36500 [Capsulimonas corticalis]
MTVTLNLPPDMEVHIQAEAAKQEVQVEEYLLQLVVAGMIGSAAADQHARSLALLESVRDIGDAEEQRETFTYLRAAVDEERLSDRKRFL